MKKSFLLFSLFSFIFSLGVTFAYTSEDTSNANYLADQGIVTKQTIASKYRLDDKILRQEVIGMALKVKGVTLPENYTCKKYFADATKNDWVCRAVELAADNGIITRSNKYANPTKFVTRAEALAMVMKAGGLNPEDLPAGGGVYSDATVGWQGIIIDAASKFGILDKDDYAMVKIDYSGEMMNDTQMVFSPNRLATRAEVFAFAKNILSLNTNNSNTALELDKTYSNEFFSFKYPSRYFNPGTQEIGTTVITEQSNIISFKVNVPQAPIKYFTNIYSDKDILDSIGYIESKSCQDPIITDRKPLYVDGVVRIYPGYSTTLDRCAGDTGADYLYFSTQGILIHISYGQDWSLVIDGLDLNHDSMSDEDIRIRNERRQNFINSFKIVTK